MYWFWGMNMFWWIFWIALLVVIFAWMRPRASIRQDAAIEVLREKFAAGEITDEQYVHRLEVLTGRASPTRNHEAPPPPHSGSPAAA